MCSRSKCIIFKVSVCSLLLSPNLAYAYIDPGTGSMLVQALIAALAAISVSFGIFWRRIRSFIARVLNREKNK